MNCVNHPEREVSAYCQNCGKALCAECVRPVAGVVYCEPCLAAKLGGVKTGGSGSTGWTAVDPRVSAGVAAAFATTPPTGPGSANPVLAGFLGLIPGVGAMYNGQFIKALIHVLVFVALIGLADHFGPAGLLIAAWVFYQVFDAAQTATARRDGLPIPDPIGINGFVERLGIPGQPGAGGGAAGYRPGPASAGYTTVPPGAAWTQTPAGTAVPPNPLHPADPSGSPQPPPGASWQEWAERAAAAKAMHDMGVPVTGSGFDPAVGAPMPYAPVPPPYASRPDATGPIVLIVVGMLFLFSTLGIFHLYWLSHSWPVLIIVLGAVLLFRRLRSAPPNGGGL